MMKNYKVCNMAFGFYDGKGFSATKEDAIFLSKKEANALSRSLGISLYTYRTVQRVQQVTCDAGRAASGIPEKKDCVVRALALSANLPYELAHQIAAEAGRKPMKGVVTRHVVNQATKHGIKFVHTWKGITLKKFIETYKTGRYICSKAGHAFAVIDGVVHDLGCAMPAGTRIKQYWQVMTYGVQPKPDTFIL